MTTPVCLVSVRLWRATARFRTPSPGGLRALRSIGKAIGHPSTVACNPTGGGANGPQSFVDPPPKFSAGDPDDMGISSKIESMVPRSHLGWLEEVVRWTDDKESTVIGSTT